MTQITLTATKVYDGTNNSSALSWHSDIDENLLLGDAAYSSSGADAGTYDIEVSGGCYSSQQGYDITLGQLTITPASLTVTASDASTTYNGTAWSGGNGVTYTGFVANENESVLSGTLAYGGTSQGAIDAGSYGITASGLSSGNYTITYNQGNLTIFPASLTVTASDASTTCNGTAWSGGNGVTYAGFVANENESVLSGTLAYGGTSQGAVNTGTYTITPSGLESNNYTVCFVDGSLTITSGETTPGTDETMVSFPTNAAQCLNEQHTGSSGQSNVPGNYSGNRPIEDGAGELTGSGNSTILRGEEELIDIEAPPGD